MKISNETNQLNFKAIKVATVQRHTKKRTPNVELYKLTQKDNKFLEKLLDKINYKELQPNLSEFQQNVWQNIFKYCIFNSQSKDTTSYIAISENKPCGIICYAGNKITDLIGLCAIPIKKGERSPLIGKTLFYMLFQEKIKDKTKCIRLEAVNDSPIDIINKYTELGFKKISSENRYTQMEIKYYEMQKTFNKLKKLISFKEITPAEKKLDYTLD